MVKIAILGDTESIKGFAAVGLDIYPCDTDTESAAEFKKIVNADYGVIFVTERLVPFLQKEIEIQPYIPARSFLVFLFSGFPKSFGFYLTAYCALCNRLIFNNLNNSMILLQ